MDLLSGRKVWNNYVFLNDSQWWDVSRMHEFKLQKLKKILTHCFHHVPAYHFLMKQAGLHPDNIHSIDVLNQMPPIDKRYILEHYTDFIPNNPSKIHGIKFHTTSGTTGQPLRYTNDANSRSMTWGSFLRFQNWMGRDFSQLYLVLKGGHIGRESLFTKVKHKVSDFLENAKTLDSYNLKPENIALIENYLRKYPKAIVRGYVLNIVDLAKILRNNGHTYKIQAVTTTAEPLLDMHRTIITDTFNCNVFDQYGCGEIGGVAYECDQHKGLHITEEHVIFETDKNNEIILTDLDNYSFPFIRYKNGDQAELQKSNCSCERNSGVIKNILGRTSDNVMDINGNPIHWGYFHHLLLHTKIAENRNLVRFQVIQTNLDEIIVNLQCDKLNAEEKSTIEKNIKNKLGNIKVTIHVTDYIPFEKSGKFKAVISKINQGR